MKCLCFPKFFPYYGNSFFSYFGNSIEFCSTQNIWETHNFRIFVFSHTFPVLWEFIFPMFWELHGFLFRQKYLRNPYIWNVPFHILFPYYGNPLFRVLGTAWISASSKKCQKPLTLKWLCFSMFFPYYGNLLFPWFGNCMELYGEVNLFCSWARPNTSILDPFVIEVWRYIQYRRLISVS